MSIAQEIKDAIRVARAASETKQDDPFKRILDQVAEGLTDEAVEARFTPAPAGRWTLVLAPAHRPANAYPMVSVVLTPGRAEVLLDSKQVARTPEELLDILKNFVTTPELLESLKEVASLTNLPVEGYLRVEPKTVSREDLRLEVSPSQQRDDIAKRVGSATTLQLRITDSRGPGTFKPERYKVLESAGFTVTLVGPPPVARPNGLIEFSGCVSRTDEG